MNQPCKTVTKLDRIGLATWRKRLAYCLCACLVASLSVAVTPAFAAKTYEFECDTFERFGDMPDFWKVGVKISRTWAQLDPVSVLSGPNWDQAEHTGGFSLLEVTETNGNLLTEAGGAPVLMLTDGREGQPDVLSDFSAGTDQINLEGYVIESFGLQFKDENGDQFDSHLNLPEGLDLAAFEEAECTVFWRNLHDNIGLGRSRGHVNRITVTEDNNPFTINAGLNDAWFNPATDGQGFFITAFPELKKVLLAWFTYDTFQPPEDATANLGDANHRWLTAVGSYSENQANMKVEIASGGIFDTATDIERVTDGSILLTFKNCNEGTVEYNLESSQRHGIVPIERVAKDNISLCEALATD